MRFLTIDCFLIWIIFHMNIWQCCCNQIFDFRVSNINKCWQRDDYVIRMFGVSLQRCVEECGKRQICEGINYRRQIQLCEVILTTLTVDLEVNTIVDGPCISVHRNDIQTQTTCDCPAHEVCGPAGVCNVQECSPFSITNGNFLGNLNNIGVRVKFTCDAGFTEANNESTATCLVSGDWSVIPQCYTDIDECDSETDTCDDNAVCENTQGSYTCTCNSGYTGDGQICTDVNECDDGTNTCDVNAECVNNPGSYTCACMSGYTGDGQSCTDVNECAAASNTCNVNAECENTQGSYTCTCNSGYTGDGQSCTDINECDAETDTCDDNADCANTQGSYACACKSGYTGDGQSCTDVNECDSESHTCGDNAVCENTQGSYTCICRSGYTEDGDSCTDVNECDAATNTCDVRALCENTQGSYTCTCTSGYTGDGVSCTDVNECNVETNTCDDNAVCENTQGSYTCTCRSGYTEDGQSCTDVNECNVETNTCDVNAVCENTQGSYTCTCKSGYTGDGDSCTDTNECVTVTDNCIANSECENTEGSYTCFCNRNSALTGQCPHSFVEREGSCYLFGSEVIGSWNRAKAYCRDNCGAHLVHIDNDVENDWIATECEVGQAYWINISDRLEEGKWIWEDTDTEAEYTNWGLDEPNDWNNQDCVIVKRDSYWYDRTCESNSWNPKPICELDPIADAGDDMLNTAYEDAAAAADSLQ